MEISRMDDVQVLCGWAMDTNLLVLIQCFSSFVISNNLCITYSASFSSLHSLTVVCIFSDTVALLHLSLLTFLTCWLEYRMVLGVGSDAVSS